MAAVHHLEFSKIAVLVTCPVLPCDSLFRVQISHKSANSAPRYSQKNIFNMASVRHLEFEKFRFLSKIHPWNGNMHRLTKFDWSRIILGWDREIMLFSEWRPSAILNLRKLQFSSRDLYWHVILHLPSEIRVDRPIRRRDIAKKRFSIWRPSAILDLLWRHHVASQNCISRSELCVKFSRRSVRRSIFGEKYTKM